MKITHQWRIVQVVEYDVSIWDKMKTFEKAMRAPWVRMIIQDKQERILLNREFRYELNCKDRRLPWGKMVDTLGEYNEILASGDDMINHVLEAVLREAKEEVGIEVINQQVLTKKVCWTTMEWDLWYVIVDDFTWCEDWRDHEEGEQIEKFGWFNKEEIMKLIGNGEIQEWRTAWMLAEFILGNKS